MLLTTNAGNYSSESTIGKSAGLLAGIAWQKNGKSNLAVSYFSRLNRHRTIRHLRILAEIKKEQLSTRREEVVLVPRVGEGVLARSG